jgi:DNA-binding PadR family transcriptional regulator
MFNSIKNARSGRKDSSIPFLSRKEAVILEMLINSGRELFGLEMVKASKGELKRGTIYVTLQRMQEKGFIDSKPEPRPAPEVGIPRRMYWSTGLGERAFAAYQEAHAILVPDFVLSQG